MIDVDQAERSAASQGVPIFMGHGSRDGVVVLERAVASRDALQDLGYAVEWHEYPMEHSVCPQEISDMQAWLQRILS